MFGVENIAKKLNIDMKYRLTKYNIEGLKKARKDAIDNGWAHFWELVLGAPVLYIVLAEPISLSIFIICSIYCVMAQRYNVIRIDEKLESITGRQRSQINREPISGEQPKDKPLNQSEQRGDKGTPAYAYNSQKPHTPPPQNPSLCDSTRKGNHR